MVMTQADLRLSGGQVLLPGQGLVEADLLIAGGRIVGLVSPGAAAAAAETCATPSRNARLVRPAGLVDTGRIAGSPGPFVEAVRG